LVLKLKSLDDSIDSYGLSEMAGTKVLVQFGKPPGDWTNFLNSFKSVAGWTGKNSSQCFFKDDPQYGKGWFVAQEYTKPIMEWGKNCGMFSQIQYNDEIFNLATGTSEGQTGFKFEYDTQDTGIPGSKKQKTSQQEKAKANVGDTKFDDFIDLDLAAGGGSPIDKFFGLLQNGNFPVNVKRIIIKSAYREMAKACHPDKDGDADLMAKVNVLYEEVMKEIGG